MQAACAVINCHALLPSHTGSEVAQVNRKRLPTEDYTEVDRGARSCEQLAKGPLRGERQAKPMVGFEESRFQLLQ